MAEGSRVSIRDFSKVDIKKVLDNNDRSVHFHDHEASDLTKTVEQIEKMDHRNIILIKINLTGSLALIISWVG